MRMRPVLAVTGSLLLFSWSGLAAHASTKSAGGNSLPQAEQPSPSPRTATW